MQGSKWALGLGFLCFFIIVYMLFWRHYSSLLLKFFFFFQCVFLLFLMYSCFLVVISVAHHTFFKDALCVYFFRSRDNGFSLTVIKIILNNMFIMSQCFMCLTLDKFNTTVNIVCLLRFDSVKISSTLVLPILCFCFVIKIVSIVV